MVLFAISSQRISRALSPRQAFGIPVMTSIQSSLSTSQERGLSSHPQSLGFYSVENSLKKVSFCSHNFWRENSNIWKSKHYFLTGKLKMIYFSKDCALARSAFGSITLGEFSMNHQISGEQLLPSGCYPLFQNSDSLHFLQISEGDHQFSSCFQSLFFQKKIEKVRDNR